jgi:glycosyltransferase involved in cell wall biosynthesis
MRTKKLIIVTTSYPYGKGEAFLEAELTHISKYFEGVELVPCYYDATTTPRRTEHDVNLEYAKKRWSTLRKFLMIDGFVSALWQYRWLDDLLHILRRQHKFENVKELARALYRAKLFERFLTDRFSKEKNELHLIYFYWMTPEIMGAIAFRDRFDPALKIVSRAHRGDLYTELRIGDYIGLRKTIVRGIDRIYCISDHGRSYLEGRYDLASGKPCIARLGVNDPGFLNAQPGDARLSIVTCSFVFPEKRLDLLVDAIRYLLDTNPVLEIKWTHVGDGVLYEQLRAYVSHMLGTRADVVFKGYLTQAQLMSLYGEERFDVFVNVSDSEGIPVSLMEASAVGIPMVATDVGGNSEIVNADNGILLPSDPDVETIASALLRFTDRSFALTCRRNARAQWEAKYNAAVNHDSFGRQLIRILERPAMVAASGTAEIDATQGKPCQRRDWTKNE